MGSYRAGGQSKRGFTLIELLVVIAIIAILAAILFPVYAKVKERARMTNCIYNQKQIFLGFSQYVTDNDEHYPPPGYTWTWGYAMPWQKDILMPYVKNFEIFFCPSTQAWARNYTPPGSSQKLGTSYSYSYWYVQDPGNWPKNAQGQPKSPSEVDLMGDLWSDQDHVREVSPRGTAGPLARSTLVQVMFDGHYRPYHYFTPW